MFLMWFNFFDQELKDWLRRRIEVESAEEAGSEEVRWF